MTAPMALVHEGCGTRHITVGGADNDLRNALAIASDGVHRRQSRALSVASRAGVSLQTQGKCGVWDGSDLLLVGLGQEGDREGEVVR